MKPINPVVFEKFRTISNEFFPVEKEIIKRISFVIDKTMHECGWAYRSWSMQGEPDGCVDINRLVKGDSINMHTITFNGRYPIDGPLHEIIVNGKVCRIFYKLPYRWLFENFTKELTKAVDLGWEREARNSELVDSAMSKLTYKEKVVLGF